MFGDIQARLQRRADLLLCGNYAAMLSDYACPIGIYFEDKVLAIRNPYEMEQLFSSVHHAMLARGVVALHPVIQAVELPRKGRQRVWARWEQIAADPAQSRTAEVIYYCRQTPAGLVTELMHYLRLGMTELQEIAPVAARSA